MNYLIYIEVILLIISMMTVVFFYAMYKKDNSIVDVFWGMGFLIIDVCILFKYTGQRGIFLTVLVTIWSLRLSIYLGKRLKRKGLDWRYENWKKEWGRWFIPRSYLQVYLLQGLMMFLISMPLLQLVPSAPSFLPIQILGSLISLCGIIYEGVADRQLAIFKSIPQNKGLVMNKGLWKYSRHPNYFGEMLVWWGIFIYVIPYANIWISIISPITITVLLLKVSGIPMLEKKLKKNDKYKEYIENTSSFIPWWSKRAK